MSTAGRFDTGIVHATVDIAAAGARTWDAVVVGAGPAGAMAARQLALRGFTVLLVERAAFPRWKVCGACVNGAALETLAAVGLERLAIEQRAVPLTAMHLAAGGQPALVPLAGRVALSRAAFDAALVTAAVRAGASFLPETLARLHGLTTSARQVALRQRDQEVIIAARVVIGADGLGGTLAGAADVRTVIAPQSRFGVGAVAADVPAAYGPGIIFMACGRGGYVGLVRIEDGRLNIAGALDPVAVRQHGGVGALVGAVLAEAGLPAVPLGALAWRGTPALTRRAVRPAAERLLLIGDAAGYVEPFTGEGIAWALAAGVAVAQVAGRACARWDAALAAEWSARHRRIVVCRQWPCHLLAALLRRPVLLRGALAVLNRAPVVLPPLLHFLELRPTIAPG